MNKNIISYLIRKGLTSSQAAEKLGVSRKLVTRWAKRYELRFPYRKGTPCVLNKSIVKILLKRGYSNKEISEIFNLDSKGISFFRKRNNLLYEQGIPYYKKNIKTLDFQKSLIIGSVLGDGHITKDGRLVVGHSLKQKNYCKWKSEKLNSKLYIDKPRFDIRTKKTYFSCRFTTKSLQYLKDLRQEIYSPEKQITKKSLQYYNALSLAVHYMDDGCKTNNSYRLSTNCFNIKSLTVFNNHCKENFGIWFTIHEENKLYLPIKFKRIFESLIKPYIHPELEYKIHK